MMLLILLEEMKKFMLDSLRYKWDSFKEEKEWRMYFKREVKTEKSFYDDMKNRLGDKSDVLVDELFSDKVMFYAKDDHLASYYPINLKEISSRPLNKVIIGPKNNTYKQDIKLFFDKEKLELPDIAYSRISYR